MATTNNGSGLRVYLSFREWPLKLFWFAVLTYLCFSSETSTKAEAIMLDAFFFCLFFVRFKGSYRSPELRIHIESSSTEDTSSADLFARTIEDVESDIEDAQSEVEDAQSEVDDALDELRDCEADLEDKKRALELLQDELDELRGIKPNIDPPPPMYYV